MLTTRQKMAIARLLQMPIIMARRLVGLGAVARVWRGGARWNLDLTEGIDLAIYLMGAFEWRTRLAYERLVGPGMIVADVGANIGAHSLPLARKVGSTGRVLAFEPTRWAIERLRANAALNPDLAGQLSIHQLMLVDDPAMAIPETIHSSWPLDPKAQDHYKLCGRSMTTEGAGAITFDDFAEREQLSRLDFVKLDVDGYECRVLGGMLSSLRRFRPPILMEMSPYVLAEKGDSLERLLEILAQARYRLFDLDKNDPIPFDAAWINQVYVDGVGANVLARSED